MSSPVRLDLHVHSDRSDGKFPVDEVLRRAASAKLDVLAIADHDLCPARPAGTAPIEGHPVRVLAAAEVSGVHDGKELHLLVYFRGQPPIEAVDFLRGRCQARAARFDQAARRLGLPDTADADALAGKRSLTRHHLAQALTRAGVVARQSDAWRHLGRDVVPLIEFSYLDAIRRARSWGALTSWAHPALADANLYLDAFVRAGLEGVEASRPGLDRPTRNGLRRLAKKHDILVSGGSDWHGWWPGNLGDFRFDDEHARRFIEHLDA
ncbi:MAG: hypothetical protein EXR71_09170 [Myxococcales bacterium]|nr:hypothetical protein [Myxococcales bacterium]